MIPLAAVAIALYESKDLIIAASIGLGAVLIYRQVEDMGQYTVGKVQEYI